MGTPRRGACALAVIALLGACSTTVHGHGVAAPAPRASAPPVGPAGQLEGRLMDPPVGSSPWNSAWAQNRRPTPQQFAAHVYPPAVVRDQVAILRAEGIQYVAHETWYAADRNQADMVLLQFSSPSGAQGRYLFATHAKSGVVGIHKFDVPGETGVVGYYKTDVDDLGNVRAIVYGRVGRYVVEEFYFSPTRISTKDASAWISMQLARLR